MSLEPIKAGLSFLNPTWEYEKEFLEPHTLLYVPIPSFQMDQEADDAQTPTKDGKAKPAVQAPRPRAYQYLEALDILTNQQ